MKFGNMLSPKDTRNLMSTLSFQEIQYQPKTDSFVRNEIEYPTEDEAYEMLREDDDLEMDDF